MNTKTIKFDLNKFKLYEKIKAKQGDTKSRFLLFQLLDGSAPFNLKNRSVRAYMIKPDGKEIFNDLIVNNYNLGYCTLELTNQVLAVPGTLKIELMVTEGDKKLTSSVFELEVVKSINSEKSIVSTNEFTALLNGLAALSEYDNYKNSVKEMEINKANKAEVEEKFISVEEKIKNNSEQLEHKVGYTTESKVHFIKTKSAGGDCILIQSTKNILIDTGNVANPQTLINYLYGYGINNIDYLIITHYHPDHVGGANAEGLIALCNSDINIGKIVLPHQKINYSSFIQSDDYKVGEIISAINNKVLVCCNSLSIPIHYPVDEEIIQLNDDTYIKFLNLKESNFNKYYNHTVNAFLTEENATNYNNFSMVVEYHTGNNDFLFASDIEELAQESIYQQLNKADVLKMEHHSLNYNCNEKYFDKIQPKIAVVMPLHPNKELGFMKNQHFNELINNGVPIFSSENGSIVIKSDYSGVREVSEATSVNRLELYNLAQGIALQDGSDLDDIKEVGIYNSVSATKTETMINSPIKGAGFKLIVEKTGLYNCLKQTCIINNTQTSISYTRQTHDENWGDWRRLSPFNEIAMSITNIDLNNLKTPGEYYSENTANTTTITNAPVKSGFRIEVKQITGGTILQKVIANSDNIQEFYRYFTNNTWQPWYTFTSSKYLKSETVETVFGQGKEIVSNSDLNSYTKEGNYSCFNETIASTVTNKPNDLMSGFKLEVKATNSNIRYQILYANDDKIGIYVRYYDVTSGFSTWKKLKFE